MKKIFISLFVIIMCFMVVGCGKEEKMTTPEKQENQINEPTIDNKETTENVVVDDDEIIEIDDEENKPPQEEVVNVSEIINCDGCVFAYIDGDVNAKKLGDSISSEEYTTDVSTIKTQGGKQRHNFFGFVLSGNTISKAYACILKDNKIYCIEGSTNGAYHNSNIGVLNQIFTGSQCRTISDGHTYTCTDGSYNGDTKTNGYTSMHYETSCTIYGSDANTGKLVCH